MNDIEKFWDIHKNIKKGNMKQETIINRKEQMQKLANEFLPNLNEDDKFYSFYEAHKNGEVVTNKYGRKLYFKLNDKK